MSSHSVGHFTQKPQKSFSPFTRCSNYITIYIAATSVLSAPSAPPASSAHSSPLSPPQLPQSGQVALPQCSLVKALHWILEQGTPWTSDQRGRWGGFTSVHEKIFRNRFVRQDGGLGGWRKRENVGGGLLCVRRGKKTKILREYEILQISIIMR